VTIFEKFLQGLYCDNDDILNKKMEIFHILEENGSCKHSKRKSLSFNRDSEISWPQKTEYSRKMTSAVKEGDSWKINAMLMQNLNRKKCHICGLVIPRAICH